MLGIEGLGSGLGVYGSLGFKAWGLLFRVWSLGLKVEGVGI